MTELEVVMRNELGWKVPFRQVYCDTFWRWVKSTVWCHIVIKVYPNASDPGGPRKDFSFPPGVATEKAP